MDKNVVITVDTPAPGLLEFTLTAIDGGQLDALTEHYHGPVDNLLLTSIDKLLKRNSIDKFALKAVQLGQGIDKNSSLYRMVQSFATAIMAADRRP